MFIKSASTKENVHLLVSLKQGNKQSFAVLYDKYAPSLSGLITRIVKEVSLVEKVLSCGFTKAFKQVTFFNPSNNSLFCWLINIARQTAFEEISTENYRMEQKRIFRGHFPVYEGQKHIFLNGSAFDLAYYGGLTYLQVADAMQTAMEKVKTSMRATMENMKQHTPVQ